MGFPQLPSRQSSDVAVTSFCDSLGKCAKERVAADAIQLAEKYHPPGGAAARRSLREKDEPEPA
jgi:hypothetical protein